MVVFASVTSRNKTEMQVSRVGNHMVLYTAQTIVFFAHLSHDMRFPTMWCVRSAQAQLLPCCYDNKSCFYSDRIVPSTKAAGVCHASVLTELVAMVREVCH